MKTEESNTLMFVAPNVKTVCTFAFFALGSFSGVHKPFSANGSQSAACTRMRSVRPMLWQAQKSCQRGKKHLACLCCTPCKWPKDTSCRDPSSCQTPSICCLHAFPAWDNWEGGRDGVQKEFCLEKNIASFPKNGLLKVFSKIFFRLRRKISRKFQFFQNFLAPLKVFFKKTRFF